MTLHQGGDHLAQRVEHAAVPELAGYTGRYFSAELETYYTLELEQGHLVVRHRRFGAVRLTHQRNDTFSGSFSSRQYRFRARRRRPRHRPPRRQRQDPRRPVEKRD